LHAPDGQSGQEQSLSERAASAGRRVMTGRGSGLAALMPFAGPAVISSVAYMDPGNFATNIQAGARYDYDLLWVVLLANLIAMLLQSLSAKLGIVTGRNLAELSRDHFPRPVVWAMWIVAEIGAIATELAELLGGAIGLSLLTDLPLLAGMAVIGGAAYLIVQLDRTGFRPIELVIAGLVAVISLSYLAELLIAPPDWRQVGLHLFVPRLADGGAMILAVGIIGATVMPHAIYLHSGLTQARIRPRDDRERRLLIRYSNREVLAALGLAGLVNIAMLAMAAVVFHDGHQEVASIETAYRTLLPLLGGAAACVFLIALIASGLSSSAVGAMAGQVVMQGFVGFHIPLWVRRLVTMVPAFAIVAAGVDATEALVLSQVVLSLVLPVPLVSLLLLTRRPDIMGNFVNSRLVTLAALLTAAIVLALNLLLLLDAAGLPLVQP
jgi:manganese transport protein